MIMWLYSRFKMNNDSSTNEYNQDDDNQLQYHQQQQRRRRRRLGRKQLQHQQQQMKDNYTCFIIVQLIAFIYFMTMIFTITKTTTTTMTTTTTTDAFTIVPRSASLETVSIPNYRHRHTCRCSKSKSKISWIDSDIKRSRQIQPVNMVSELHIPGYTETKKSFVVATDYMDSTAIENNSHTLPNYKSLLPYSNGYLIHETIDPVLSIKECTNIIDEAEYIAQYVHPWTTKRHGNYPTTDLPLKVLPNTLQLLNNKILVSIIYPLLRQQFGMYLPNPYSIRIADGFIVKYTESGQRELTKHRDGSIISINIALNPSTEYTGGGTWFASLDTTNNAKNVTTSSSSNNNNSIIKLQQGTMLSHASGLLHAGSVITSGTRYILVAFCIIEGYDSWSMRFYNSIRNHSL